MVNKRNYSICLKVLLCSFIIGLMACTAERSPCLEPTLAKVNVNCYQYDTSLKAYRDTILPKANFVSPDIDSAHYWYWAVPSNAFSIVLSPLHDTVRWTLQVDSGYSKIDTLFFIYEHQLYFYSNACGYGYNYTLSQVLYTKQNLDSVRISNADITPKAGIEHVKIYL